MSRFNPREISCQVYMGPGSRLSYDLRFPDGRTHQGSVNSWPLCEDGFDFLFDLGLRFPVGHVFESIGNVDQLYGWLNSHVATGDYVLYGQK